MGVITYFLLAGAQLLLPAISTNQTTSGYTPFDRDTQQLEMEAIIAGDYQFKPGMFRCLSIHSSHDITYVPVATKQKSTGRMCRTQLVTLSQRVSQWTQTCDPLLT